jgi:hypothetical protein
LQAHTLVLLLQYWLQQPVSAVQAAPTEAHIPPLVVPVPEVLLVEPPVVPLKTEVQRPLPPSVAPAQVPVQQSRSEVQRVLVV